MYNSFAEVYDGLMSDVDYKGRTAYLMRLFKKHGGVPTLLLDVACGTGGFSIEFAKQGIQVIGVDMSEEMLSAARENSLDANTDILLLCQRAEELDLYGTVDGAICCMDSLNHITDYKTLCKALRKVSLFLEEEKLFIFDVNTEYKHRKILGNNTFVIEQGSVYCVWQNEYNPESRVTDIALDFFVCNGENYRRSSEYFSERAYTAEELQKAIESAGLEILAVYDDLSEKPLSEESDRAIYVTKRRKNG